jgi:hypothetical protein
VEVCEGFREETAEFRGGGSAEQERGGVEEAKAFEGEGTGEVSEPSRAKPEGIADEGGAEDDAEQSRRMCGGGHDGQRAGKGLAEDEERLVVWEGVENQGKKVRIVFGNVGRVGDDNRAESRREVRERGAEHDAGAVKAGEKDEGGVRHWGSLVRISAEFGISATGRD